MIRISLSRWSWTIWPVLLLLLAAVLPLPHQASSDWFMWSLPLAVAMALANLLGPRVLPLVYLAACLSAGLANFHSPQLFLMALPPTLAAFLSWFLFRYLHRGVPALPDQRQLAHFLFLGLFLPVSAGVLAQQLLSFALNNVSVARFYPQLLLLWFSNLACAMAVTAPLMIVLSMLGLCLGRECSLGEKWPPISWRARTLLYGGALLVLLSLWMMAIDFSWPLLAAAMLLAALRLGIRGALFACAMVVLLSLIIDCLPAFPRFSGQHLSLEQAYLLLLFVLGATLLVGRGISDLRTVLQQRDVAKAELQQEKAWQSLYFELPMIGMGRVGVDGRWLAVNDKLCEMLGFSRQAMLQKTWQELTAADDLPYNRTVFEETLRGEREGYVLDKRLLKQDGAYLDVQVTTRVIQRAGQVHCLLVMVQDISERVVHQQQVARLAFYDELTGLPNRRMLLDRLSQEIVRSQREDYLCALLFLDLDHFKHVNDSLGHPAGDALLQIVARRLQDSIREADTLARLGGDEFVIMLLHVGYDALEASENATRVARKIIDSLRVPVLINGSEISTGTSVGITLFPTTDLDPAVILKQADTAMYRAKESGRSTYMFFSAAMQEAANQRLKLQNDLARAIERNELSIELQPQVDLRSRRIFGAEVLLRWHSLEYGQIAPNVFVPIAEEMGLLPLIGDWLMNECCQQIAAWQPLFEQGRLRSLSVNISARQLQHPDFAAGLMAVLMAHQIEPAWLQLEITESAVMRESERVIATMTELKSTGITFALDDFGTGASSLTNLKRLPLDAMKIDRCFMEDIRDAAQNNALVEAMILAAQQLGLMVIAEGVETEVQGDYLYQHGCLFAQGYFYGRPMRPADFYQLVSGPSVAV